MNLKKKEKTKDACCDLLGLKLNLIFILNPHPLTWDPAAPERGAGWQSEGLSQHSAAHTCSGTKASTPVGAEVRAEPCRDGGVEGSVPETWMISELSTWSRAWVVFGAPLRREMKGSVWSSPGCCLAMFSRCAPLSGCIWPSSCQPYLLFEVWGVFHSLCPRWLTFQ